MLLFFWLSSVFISIKDIIEQYLYLFLYVVNKNMYYKLFNQK